MPANPSAVEALCLRCGLCCNGVLFKDVELQTGDDAQRLTALGLPVRNPGSGTATQKFPQPCAALCADNRCQIYSERPARCREFECALLKSVLTGDEEEPAALRIIGLARERAERVRGLLRRLGDKSEHVALSIRFNRLKRRLERGCADEQTADAFAELTLAVHELNLLLSTKFYPGSGD